MSLNPITYIINNLHSYNYEKNEILKILACLKRTCKEFRYYINNELDKTNYLDPLYNILWRDLDKKSVIYNTFNDYNKYLKNKKK